MLTLRFLMRIGSSLSFLSCAPCCCSVLCLLPCSCSYDLYGVSNHSGTASGGHYTASAKVSDDPAAPFFLFNDSSVHAVSRDAIKGPAAYLLFYRRRGS